MKTPIGSSKKILSNLFKNRILGGLELGEDKILICCTETNTVQDIESFVSVIKETTMIK
jgi:glycine cleavage system pyridoxal-binding protein P